MRKFFLFYKGIVLWQTVNGHQRCTPSLWAASQIPAACKCCLLDTPGLLGLLRFSDSFTEVSLAQSPPVFDHPH